MRDARRVREALVPGGRPGSPDVVVEASPGVARLCTRAFVAAGGVAKDVRAAAEKGNAEGGRPRPRRVQRWVSSLACAEFYLRWPQNRCFMMRSVAQPQHAVGCPTLSRNQESALSPPAPRPVVDVHPDLHHGILVEMGVGAVVAKFELPHARICAPIPRKDRARAPSPRLSRRTALPASVCSRAFGAQGKAKMREITIFTS